MKGSAGTLEGGVTASIPPLAAIVRDLAGSGIAVTVILPPGADPHGYEPSPRAARRVADAHLHFVVGRHLDDWAAALARGVDDGARVVELAAGFGDEEAAGAGSALGDPHVWMDPRKAAVMAERVSAALIEAFPDQAEPIRHRLRDTTRRYAVLDSLCAARLDPLRAVPFASSHGGLNHLVARYGLNQIAVLEAFHGVETTPRQLKEIVTRLEESEARVIFVEPQSGVQLARTVSLETGVPVVELDALMALGPDRSYETFLRDCVEEVARALSREARP